LWAVRESYLRFLHEQANPTAALTKTREAPKPEMPPAPPPGPTHNFLPQYTHDLSEAVSALRLAETAAELKKAGTRIVQLQQEKAAAEQRARMDSLEAENAKLSRRIEREAKKKAAITAAKLLLRTLGKR